MKTLLFLSTFFLSLSVFSQNVGIGTNSPNNNAKFEVADSVRGILIPRMDSAHRKAIPNTIGLLVYDSTYKSFWYNNGSEWVNMAASIASSSNLSSVPQPIDADGNVYPITKIGAQWWMAANLKTTHYSNGDSISNIKDAAEWTSRSSGAWCYYNNDSSNNITYGKLYNWYAASDNRNACPVGWHLPNESDWSNLNNYIIANGGINLLRTAGTSLWINAPGTGESYGNNRTGFSGVPGGYRSKQMPPLGTIVSFLGKHEWAIWWSAKSEISSNPPQVLYARYWGLTSNAASLMNDWYTAETGYSVRCVRD